tara:strand:- start:1501 stop:2496 length:996 start_codon:yes stop_codon:yes gene_type:complete
MGNSMGTPVSKMDERIADEMVTYSDKWFSRQDAGATKGTQTEVFRAVVPREGADFTETFNKEGFEEIFTSDKVTLKMAGPYNSNMLYRDSLGICKIPVYSDAEFTVQVPMGTPGLHLGDKHGSKASHLMIVRHTEDGPVTFNEMLPSSSEETIDLHKRLSVLDLVVKKIKENVLVSDCGPRVMEKVRSGWDGSPLGDPNTMTIRDYLVQVITKMPEDIRSGRPGYVLNDSSDTEVSKDPVKVLALINALYGGENMKTFKAIQPPSENSQFISHIHCFQLPDGVVPECMASTYYDCDIILDLKKKSQNIDQSEEEEEEEEGGLTRQSTVARS